MSRQINQAGLDLIKKFEGLKLTVYLDQVVLPTVGYGHKDIAMTVGDSITQAEADQFLTQDLSTAENAVSTSVRTNINDNEFAALVSFVYNLGQGAFRQSHLLECLNQGKMQDAAAEFVKWCHAGGKVSPGLLARRIAEKELFLT